MIGGCYHAQIFSIKMESCKLFCLCWPGATILPISASQVARITGVSHWHPALKRKDFTLKLVQERVENTLELTGIGEDFLNGTPAAQQLRDSIDKWDFIK
jgi:hypothetical protein